MQCNVLWNCILNPFSLAASNFSNVTILCFELFVDGVSLGFGLLVIKTGNVTLDSWKFDGHFSQVL